MYLDVRFTDCVLMPDQQYLLLVVPKLFHKLRAVGVVRVFVIRSHLILSRVEAKLDGLQ